MAIHVSKLWSFIQSWKRLEEHCFGALLSSFGSEAKGSHLLDRDRFRWAAQGPALADEERRKLARAFLEMGRGGGKPRRENFTAYGQACLEAARGAFDVLFSHEAELFAAMIPRGVRPPAGYEFEDYLRKDQVFLFERYYYFLEGKASHGLLVMDETEKTEDRKFVGRLEAYFQKTSVGRNRSYRIVPSPLFVSSDMSFGVQAADICLYCINWGFRLARTEQADIRTEIADEFGPKLARLQWRGQGYRDGNVFQSFGIVHVADPFESRS